MNKKGFTLVEMLVVIAIIAVLVAIIVPTAVGATKKAAAATNAANLRSYASQCAIAKLTGDAMPTPPTAKDCEAVKSSFVARCYEIDGQAQAFFFDGSSTSGYGIAYFEAISEGKTSGSALSPVSVSGSAIN